jgi:hypothetical protein
VGEINGSGEMGRSVVGGGWVGGFWGGGEYIDGRGVVRWGGGGGGGMFVLIRLLKGNGGMPG